MADNLIRIGQALITQEEYESNKAYYDASGFLGAETGAPVYNGDGGSDYYDILNAYLNKVKEIKNIKYRYKGGDNSDPFATNGTIKVDNPHFVTWLLKNSGIKSNMTDLLAMSGMDTLLYKDVLDVVNPLMSASDDYNSKLNYLSISVKGDILFFDTFSRNSTVGMYLGSGEVLAMIEDGLSILNLWNENDDGTYDFTFWMEKFNGTIKRLPILNKEDYIWHAKIME